MISYEHFAAGFASLCELFNAKPSHELTDLYFNSVQDLTPEEWTIAVERATGSAVYMPKPAELRNFAGRGEQQRKLEAVVAWEIVRAAMDKYDYVRSMDFGPMVNAVVRNMGGWIHLCDRTERDLTFERRRFEELYLLFAGTKISAQRAAPLRGQFGGKPVLFQIPGQPPRRVALPEGDSPGLQLVHGLADRKGAA